MLKRNDEDGKFEFTCDTPKCQATLELDQGEYTFMGAIDEIKSQGWNPYQETDTKLHGSAWKHRCPDHNTENKNIERSES